MLIAAKERAQRERRSLGDVLSDLARQALTGRTQKAETEEKTAVTADSFGFEPLPHRGPAVSQALIDQLRDEEGV